MEISKIGLSSDRKIINPFRTSRNSASTNPFKYQDFEGNTIDPLVCADVLVSFKSKPSKLKMITSSVAGSMTKLHTSITEPIKNFVNRVRNGISGAWEFSKNTNISDLPGFKQINNVMKMDIADIGKGISDSISKRLSVIDSGITNFGKDINEKWAALVGRIHSKKINSDVPVDELRTMWEAEIALAKEVA